jgi:hypothetical protein
VPDFAEVLLAQPKESRAEELCIAANAVVGVRVKLAAVGIAPFVLRLIFRLRG